MAYQVLARKYRPQHFADVAGQAHVTVTLMNALTQGRIAHGYIFSGHRGIGKTTVARILAMALNCRTPIGDDRRPTAEPCETCESCAEIRAGNAVDVIEIDAATNRGIDEIRELRDAARYRPARDRYKIYILDEAHQITDAAFNALLKTLEEPPDHIVFMMATTQPEDIPQTVRSRCQHFSFHAVKMADILRELRGIAEREGVEANESALGLLAEAGDGSMRDALSIMDQAIASAPVDEGRPRLDAGQIRDLMGTVSNAVFERIFQAVDGGRSAEVVTVANEMLDAGNSPAQLARQCVRYLRNCLMAKISGVTGEGTTADGGDAALLQISPDERRRVGRTAALFSEEEMTRFLQVMLRTFDELGYRQEPRFHFELGLLKLVHLRRLLPMEEVLSALPLSGAVGQVGAGATAATSASRIAATGSAPSAAAGALSPATPVGAIQNPARGVIPAASSDAVAGFSPFRADQARKAEPVAPLRPAPIQASGLPIPAPQVSRVGVRASEPTANAASASPALAIAAATDTTMHEQHVETAPAMSLYALEEDGQTAPKTPSSPDLPKLTPVAASGSSSEALRQAVVDALLAMKGQSSAAEALADATWTSNDGVVRAQMQLSKRMLPMVMNAEAERAARAALQQVAPGLKLEFTATTPETLSGSKPKRSRPARSGTAQAKAEEHPVVQEAQRLFQAEIRNVIDLSEGAS